MLPPYFRGPVLYREFFPSQTFPASREAGNEAQEEKSGHSFGDENRVGLLSLRVDPPPSLMTRAPPRRVSLEEV